MLVEDLFITLSRTEYCYELSDLIRAINQSESSIQDWRSEKGHTEYGVNDKLVKLTYPFTDWNKRQTTWQNILLTHLVKTYDCQGFLRTDEYGKIGFYATGRDSNLKIIQRQYQYFNQQLDRIAERTVPAHLKRGVAKGWYNEFYLSAVESIGKKLLEVRFQVMTSDWAAKVFLQYAKEATDFHSGKIRLPEIEIEVAKTEAQIDAEIFAAMDQGAEEYPFRDTDQEAMEDEDPMTIYMNKLATGALMNALRKLANQ